LCSSAAGLLEVRLLQERFEKSSDRSMKRKRAREKYSPACPGQYRYPVLIDSQSSPCIGDEGKGTTFHKRGAIPDSRLSVTTTD